MKAELTTTQATRILGVNFWESQRATFDFVSKTITIRYEVAGEKLIEVIPFWPRDGKLAIQSRAKAAQCCAAATEARVKLATAKNTRGAANSAAHLKELKERYRSEAEDMKQQEQYYHRVANIAEGSVVAEAPVYLAEDVVIPCRRAGKPGRVDRGVIGIVAIDPHQTSASQLFATTSSVITVPRTIDDGSEALEEEGREVIKVRPVADMILRPQLSADSKSVQVQLAMMNDSDEDVVLRKGTRIAAIREADAEDIAEAVEVDSDYDEAEEAQTTAAVETNTGAAEEEPNVDSRVRELTGRQVVKWVEEGNVVHGIPFPEWIAKHNEEIKFGPRTSQEDKDAIQKLLYVFQRVVAADPKKPGALKGVEFTLTLKDPNVTPVKCKYRRYSPAEKEVIRDECHTMLERGIVEYSDSPWSAPVVLVRKKDKGWRFCVNFTATCNPHIKLDAEPLWKSQDVLEELGSADKLSLWDVARDTGAVLSERRTGSCWRSVQIRMGYCSLCECLLGAVLPEVSSRGS